MKGKRENEEEVVYNLIVPEKKRYEKSPRYKSKFRDNAVADLKKVKYSHKTMGYASVPLPEPTGYLHKHTRLAPPRPELEGPRCLAREKKPPLPPNPLKLQQENLRVERNEQENVKKEKSMDGKDRDGSTTKPGNYFRMRNIVNVSHSKPPRRELKIADTCRGDKQTLLPSGLAPLYLYKKDYGKLPKYLLQLRKEVEKPTDIEKEEQEGMTCIEGEARKSLLQGLKKNWSELQTAYQTLPIMVDTIPKIKKKLNLEKELIHLEKDIAFIEKHPIIFICGEKEKTFSS